MITDTQKQFFRFAIVGTLSNGILYLFYLGLTSAGVGHKLAMSILYAVGIIQTFYFNKKWTFQQSGETHRAFVRYWLAYGTGYLLNLLALFVFVDWRGWPHQTAQGVMILVSAGFLFILQKFWVFAQPKSNH